MFDDECIFIMSPRDFFFLRESVEASAVRSCVYPYRASLFFLNKTNLYRKKIIKFNFFIARVTPPWKKIWFLRKNNCHSPAKTEKGKNIFFVVCLKKFSARQFLFVLFCFPPWYILLDIIEIKVVSEFFL